MAVEVRELVIRANIVDNSKAQSPTSSPNAFQSEQDPDLIVEECVKQVLQILEAQQER